MRVGIWGAGTIGTGLAYRLTMSPHVSELYWTNRSFDTIRARCIDLRQGLAFAPTCHSIEEIPMSMVGEKMVPHVDLLIVTAGKPVAKGATRETVFRENFELFSETVLSQLTDYQGIVLIISNPVDLMTQITWELGVGDAQRVIGLGTVVETARLRSAIAGHLPTTPPAREVTAYAVGTHDEYFVPIAERDCFPGLDLTESRWAQILETSRREVANAAQRVKMAAPSHGVGTLHPIVEAAVRVTEAVATDRREILTISVREPGADLFYSVPCSVGSRGILEQFRGLLHEPRVAASLQVCRDELTRVRATVD